MQARIGKAWLLGLTLSLSACGSDDDGGGAASTGGTGNLGGTGGTSSAATVPEVCPLFTKDLAEQLTNKAVVGEGMASESGDTRLCDFELEDSYMLSGAYIAPSDGDAASYVANCAGTVIDGVGPWACLVPEAPEEGILTTLATGNDEFEVGVYGDTGDLEAYKAVARAMLQKLP